MLRIGRCDVDQTVNLVNWLGRGFSVFKIAIQNEGVVTFDGEHDNYTIHDGVVEVSTAKDGSIIAKIYPLARVEFIEDDRDRARAKRG